MSPEPTAHAAADVLSMWTVYRQPLDYPSEWVARRFEIRPGAPEPVRTDDLLRALSLGDLRRQLPPGLYCLPRSPDDDPVIWETWF